jgi:hypothetical protein
VHHTSGRAACIDAPAWQVRCCCCTGCCYCWHSLLMFKSWCHTDALCICPSAATPDTWRVIADKTYPHSQQQRVMITALREQLQLCFQQPQELCPSCMSCSVLQSAHSRHGCMGVLVPAGMVHTRNRTHTSSSDSYTRFYQADCTQEAAATHAWRA